MVDGEPCSVPVGSDTDFTLGSSHLLQPRRIIPGQKVHASILYANLYQPHATLGEGFDVPIIHCGLEDLELDKQFWETGFFDESAAKELVNYLSSSQGVAPVYLARLLFMLRFSTFFSDFSIHFIIASLFLQRRENNASGTYLDGTASLGNSSSTLNVRSS